MKRVLRVMRVLDQMHGERTALMVQVRDCDARIAAFIASAAA
jgi:hypothetical protein